VKSIIENFTFKYDPPSSSLYFTYPQINYRMLCGQKITTLSPHRVIVYTASSIPPQATHTWEIYKQVDKLSSTHIHLAIGDCFNKPVDKLPLTLTHLAIGDHFTKSADKLPLILQLALNSQAINKLPPMLTHLTLGYMFNKLVNKLPPTLTHLTTGDQFNQPVDKLPPHSPT
jgi:hypothetical protein